MSVTLYPCYHNLVLAFYSLVKFRLDKVHVRVCRNKCVIVAVLVINFVRVFNEDIILFSVREDLITNPSPQCPVVFDYKVFTSFLAFCINTRNKLLSVMKEMNGEIHAELKSLFKFCLKCCKIAASYVSYISAAESCILYQ